MNQALTAKQHEFTHAQQDNARLSQELTHSQTELHQAQRELRALQTVRDQWVSAQRQLDDAQHRLQEQHADTIKLVINKEELEQQVNQLKGRVQQLEVELAGAHATATTQTQIMDTFRTQLAASVSQKSKTPRGGESLIIPLKTIR